MYISKTKLKTILIMLSVVLFESLIVSNLLSGKYNLNIDSSIILVSWMGIIILTICILLWKKIQREVFSPYTIFLFVLFIFTCGQCIGWAFGLDMGTKDLWYRTDHNLNHELLLKGISYSIMAFSMFFLGSLISRPNNKKILNKKNRWSQEEVILTFQELGKLILLICIPAFSVKMVQDLSAVFAGGYHAYYEVNASRSGFMSIMNLLSNYYQPCMLILLVGYRKNRFYRRLIVSGMLLDVAMTLYIGGRSDAVLTLLAIALAYHYFIKPFKLKQAIVGGAFGYIAIAFLNSLGSIRGVAGRGLSDFVAAFGSSFSNVFGDFVGELGWTLTSVCWTMNLVPSPEYPFRHGMSYVAAFVSWIPSVFFGGRANHPATIWSNLADWLAKSLHMGYGPGYTTTAESYINFGWIGGLLFMLVEGFIISKIIAKVKREDIESDLFHAVFQIIIIMVVMKSLVRSSFSVVFRSMVFTILPLYCLIRYKLMNMRK